MKYFWVSLIYVGFFGLIGFAVFYTKSAMPLWALLLTPTMKWNDNKEKIDKID